MSRRHARILAVHNRYYVQDLGSTNGTFVNRNRVTNAPLTHGDLVAFGQAVARFAITADLDTGYRKKLNLDALTSLAEAVDEKDPYSGKRSEAVGRVAQRLAVELGFSPAAAEQVGVAPAGFTTLARSASRMRCFARRVPLDSAELALIHKHPVESEAILAPLEG